MMLFTAAVSATNSADTTPCSTATLIFNSPRCSGLSWILISLRSLESDACIRSISSCITAFVRSSVVRWLKAVAFAVGFSVLALGFLLGGAAA